MYHECIYVSCEFIAKPKWTPAKKLSWTPIDFANSEYKKGNDPECKSMIHKPFNPIPPNITGSVMIEVANSAPSGISFSFSSLSKFATFY